MVLYFAYGSNMDWERMKERCPTAKFVTTALLPEHKLAFTRKATTGKFRGHGVADVVKSSEDSVWGVVFQIDEIDLGRVHKYEGYNPNIPDTDGYKREERRVLEDGKENLPLTVWTYVVQKKAERKRFCRLESIKSTL
jgi:gamma-glutamylcyclotransferase